MTSRRPHIRGKARGRAGSRAKRRVPSFLGPHLVAEIAAALPYLAKEGEPLSRKAFRQILRCAAKYVSDGTLSSAEFMAVSSCP